MVVDRLVLLQGVRVERFPVRSQASIDADHMLGDEDLVEVDRFHPRGPVAEHGRIGAEVERRIRGAELEVPGSHVSRHSPDPRDRVRTALAGTRYTAHWRRPYPTRSLR